MAVAQLSRFDADCQMILCRWKRAGGIRREGAGRIHCSVEIQHHFVILRQIRVQKSTGRISFPTRGQVFKDEEEDIAFAYGIEP